MSPKEKKPGERAFPIGRKKRSIAIQNLAVADNPCGMLAAAAKLPSSSCTITAFYRYRFADRAECTTGVYMRVRTINLSRCFPPEVTSENAIFAANR